MTPLHYSVKFGHKAVTKPLLDRGVLINSGIHREAWELAPNSTPKVPCVSAGLTPLHFATLTGDLVMTEFLLEHGADPNAPSDYGESPLHLALRTTLYGTKYQDDWVDPYLRAERLLDFIDFEEDDVDAIIADISQHRIEVLDALLSDPRTSLTVQDYENEYPLHCIPYNQPESTTVIQNLVSRGADLFCRNSKQQTALHFASLAGDDESVLILLSLGAELTLTDDEGLNPLHYPARSGDYKTITAILRMTGQ